MNINSVLKSEGIKIKSELNKKQVHKISSIIAKDIFNTFSEYGINKNDVYSCLNSINMYIADFTYEDSMAKYFSKINSIFFNSKMDFENIDTLVIHECIHAIQTHKISNGKITKLGLFNIQKSTGEGINEAAVQLMASKVANIETDSVKYYDLEFNTTSPLFYPIQTALINEIMYFVGQYPLYCSTLFCNDLFKNTLIAKTNQKIYNKIEKNFDLLVQYETELLKYSNKLANLFEKSNKYQKINSKVKAYKQLIIEITFETQNLIMTSCFSSEFNLLKNLDDIVNFKAKLSKFKNYIIHNSSYNFYDTFYSIMTNKCIEKANLIQEQGSLNYSSSAQFALINIDTCYYDLNFFKKLFRKIKLLFEEKVSIKEK